jgi:hypothetical protein
MDKGIKGKNFQAFSLKKNMYIFFTLAFNFNDPFPSFPVPATVHCCNLNNNKKSGRNQDFFKWLTSNNLTQCTNKR